MTDEREKKERVFDWFALFDCEGNLEAVDNGRLILLGHASMVGMHEGFKILPCRVIVEDEP